jgi:hypothetical protein
VKLVPMTRGSAQNFVEKHHRHNTPPVGDIFRVGLEYEGQIVGVAMAGRPVARKLDDGRTLEVLRVCVLDSAPKGACSKLYRACQRAAAALGYERLLTYTLATESGASLRGAGWLMDASLPPARRWIRSDGAPRARQATEGQIKIRWLAPIIESEE